MTEPVIEAVNLVKDHVSNLLRKRSRALHGLNLTVNRGEAFGLLGPNGAGKTTTVKLLLGLLRPTSGQVRVLGHEAGDVKALEKIGFLPENPYFYSYLTAGEFLDFFGQLFKLSTKERKERAQQLLEMVSLNDAGDKPIRKFSKGMLQRLGVAQCLLNDPEVIFLDEPNSGLDPVGRRDIRRIIMQLKEQGKTIFLNSHLLPDVSELCDRIMILNRGRCVAEGYVKEIASSGNYHDLEEYFMDAVTKAELEYQESKKQSENGGSSSAKTAIVKPGGDSSQPTPIFHDPLQAAQSAAASLPTYSAYSEKPEENSVPEKSEETPEAGENSVEQVLNKIDETIASVESQQNKESDSENTEKTSENSAPSEAAQTGKDSKGESQTSEEEVSSA